MVIEEVYYEASGRRFWSWSADGEARRIGEFIMLVNWATIVPED